MIPYQTKFKSTNMLFAAKLSYLMTANIGCTVLLIACRPRAYRLGICTPLNSLSCHSLILEVSLIQSILSRSLLTAAALNHVLTVTTPEEFMALLPSSGSIDFYLPFIEHSCKLYLSRQVAEELHSKTTYRL